MAPQCQIPNEEESKDEHPAKKIKAGGQGAAGILSARHDAGR